MKKLVLTGAAGRLGSYLREPLSELCDNLVSTDLVEGIGSTYSGETYIKADLANFDEVNALMDGAEMIVHFGALSDEDTFDEILSSNIIGAYNVWEAAARNHVVIERRKLFVNNFLDDALSTGKSLTWNGVHKLDWEQCKLPLNPPFHFIHRQ